MSDNIEYQWSGTWPSAAYHNQCRRDIRKMQIMGGFNHDRHWPKIRSIHIGFHWLKKHPARQRGYRGGLGK